MYLAAFTKPKYRARGSIVTALDIGTSKICCLIARVEEDMRPRVIGIGHQLSHGVKNGVVVDVEAAATAIGQAVHSAEQMANETIREVIVSISGSHLQSLIYDVAVDIQGHAVADGDINRVLQAARQQALQAPGARMIHAIPMSFAVDQNTGIKDPRGLFGNKLSAQVHMVMGDQNVIRTIIACIERKHLEVEGIVASAFAAGLSALVDDELALGATIIDMGGGTTSVGVFQNGQLVYTDCIQIGGHHVTMDIARGLTTPLAAAERMKTLYGSAMATSSDDRELIDVPQVGEEDSHTPNHVPRSLLIGIVQPRIEETLELAREHLEASGTWQSAGRRIILTGGASQMPGARDLAQVILDKQVRQGKPLRVTGLAEAVNGPAFAAAAGLLLYPLQHFANPDAAVMDIAPSTKLIDRVRHWLKENL